MITPGDTGKMTNRIGCGNAAPSRPERSVWVGLFVVSGIALSTFFACATPFAAIATLAALKLGSRGALAVIGLVWLTNQAIGYGLLGYPWTWDSAAWGLAIGLSAAVAVLAASGLSTTRPAPLVMSLPFVAAFAAFELGLYGAGLVLPGSDAAFGAAVIGHIFTINAFAFCGLALIHHIAMMLWPLVRNDASMQTV
jgi:hypothetical protein